VIYAHLMVVWMVDTRGWRRIVRPHSTDRWKNSRFALFLQELLVFAARLVARRDCHD
jgi:hypothetical protein